MCLRGQCVLLPSNGTKGSRTTTAARNRLLNATTAYVVQETTRAQRHRVVCVITTDIPSPPQLKSHHELGKRPTSPGRRNAPPVPLQPSAGADTRCTSNCCYCCSAASLTTLLSRTRYVSRDDPKRSRSCSQKQSPQRCHGYRGGRVAAWQPR